MPAADAQQADASLSYQVTNLVTLSVNLLFVFSELARDLRITRSGTYTIPESDDPESDVMAASILSLNSISDWRRVSRRR